jgi:hypothetical protein
MGAVATEAGFTVWGMDQTPYGPVELPALVSWIKDERVTADTWVYTGKNCIWQKASDIPELQMFFRPKSSRQPGVAAEQTTAGLDPRALRRVKILAGLTDEQLERFGRFVEIEKIPQWSVIVRQGEYGDSMYLILDGELRVRITVMGKETILTTLTIGEFFGDISLFDHGPRAADVVANTESLVAKLSAAGFRQLAIEAPDLATPFLIAVGKTLTARIRADNKRYSDSVKFARAAE